MFNDPQNDAVHGKARILVVDDSQMSQVVVRRYCQGFGYDVDVVSNGPCALEHLAGNHCDLVLMDVEMPRMDGIETARRIRHGEAGEDARSVVIVAMTSHSLEDKEKGFQDVGIDGAIAKPLDQGELQKVLENSLRTLDSCRVLACSNEVPAAAPPAQNVEAAIEDSDLGPLLDADAALQRMGGDLMVYEELRKIFFREHPEQLQALAKVKETTELQLMVRIAHQLKNHYKTLGAVSCGNLCAQLETAARDKNVEHMQALCRRLFQENERLLPLLRS